MNSKPIVLITGATGGLGGPVTRAFLAAGAHCIATYRKEAEFADLAKTCDPLDRLEGQAADLTEAASVDALFATIRDRHGRLDVLANLVGGFWMGPAIADTDPADWQRMITLNLTTAFLVNRGAAALMADRGGQIINVSARPALELPAGMGAYGVSKAGVLALTEVVAKEGKDHGIRANAVLPGVIDTPANREAMPDADPGDWVTPEAIAAQMVAIALSERPALSGTALKMYGKM